MNGSYECIDIRLDGHVPVVATRGSHMLEDHVLMALRREIDDVVRATGTSHIVVDLSSVAYASSSFMGILIHLDKMLKERNGTLVLCGIAPPIRELMRIIRLDRLWEIFPTVTEAVDFVSNFRRRPDAASDQDARSNRSPQSVFCEMFTLKIHFTESPAVKVIAICPVDRGLTDECIAEFKKSILEVTSHDKGTNVILDCGSVDYMDGTILGALILAHRQVQSHGAKVFITGLRPEIHETFAITRMDRLYTIVPTIEDALALL